MEKRIYFKNLNALRFIAATLVIFHHVEQYKLWAKLPNIFGHPTIDALGHKAVSFFFVLSGFLITYLLMVENTQTGKIDVRNFYIRRILRIWPLYYFIVLLCLFVLPNIFDLSVLGSQIYTKHFPIVTSLLLLVLPNVVRLFQPGIVGGNQLWSIGVEEQF
jgi:peptidoglycan/LPS O-acetylase OafA/YrhL